MSKKKWTIEQFIDAVNSSYSYAEVITKLGLKVAGSNYDTVKRQIKKIKFKYFPHDRKGLESRGKV